MYIMHSVADHDWQQLQTIVPLPVNFILAGNPEHSGLIPTGALFAA